MSAVQERNISARYQRIGTNVRYVVVVVDAIAVYIVAACAVIKPQFVNVYPPI